METKFELNKNVSFADKKELKFERELQNDVVLPDYCDDINRFIRIDAKPIIKNKYANKDVVRVNGVVAITVVYISDPSKQLRSFSFTNDFDDALDVPGVMSNHNLNITMDIGEVNCKLLTSRKMTVKINKGILVKSHENQQNNIKEFDIPYISDLEENPNLNISAEMQNQNTPHSHIEKLNRTFEVCNELSGEAETKISENISIESESSANEIIYADVNLFIDEVKPLYGKVAIKWTADLKLLYNTVEDKNIYIKTNKKITGTQLVDIDDLDEKYNCVAKANLSSLKADIDVDQ